VSAAAAFSGDESALTVIGYLESADRQVVSGWAYAKGAPDVPVRVEIIADGVVVARTTANLPRPDVRAAGLGHGQCGFSVMLPAPLSPLRRHEIVVRPIGGAALAGSPVVVEADHAPFWPGARALRAAAGFRK